MTGLSKVRAVLVKELRDCLRDRRTIFANFVIPLLLYPLMMLLLSEATQVAQARRQRETYRVAVDPGTELPFLNLLATQDALRELEQREPADPPKTESANIKVVFEHVSDPDAALRSGMLQAVVRLPEHFQRTLEMPAAGETPLRVEILYDKAETRSREAVERVRKLFERYGREVVKQRLEARGLQEDLLRPFEISEPRNVASKEKLGGSALGTLVPLWFIIMIISGALHPAIDMTAGEKERATLESLIAAPVRPLEIIAGKFLAVAALALANATLNVITFAATFHLVGATRLPDFQVPWSALPAALLLLLPLTLLFSALLLAVASLATSTKEAQVYCLPVFLVPMLGLMVSSIPGIELEGPLLVAPVVNVALLIRELFLGRDNLAQAYLFVLSSTGLYAAAAVALAARVFAREEILFAAQGSLRLFLNRKHFPKIESPRAGDVLLAAALIFPFWFYGSAALGPKDLSALETADLVKMLVLPQLAAFLLLPLGLAWYLRAQWPATFRWRTPSARAVLAALCFGASTWVLAIQFIALQARLWPPPTGDLGGLGKTLQALPPIAAVLLFALLPAVCEEHFFRGLMLSGLRRKSGQGKWTAILITAAIFAAFHIPLFRQPVTFALGVAFGYLARESRSIWPSMLAHLAHNALSVLLAERLFTPAQLASTVGQPNPPPAYVAAALAIFALGLWLARGCGGAAQEPALQTLPARDKTDGPVAA